MQRPAFQTNHPSTAMTATEAPVIAITPKEQQLSLHERIEAWVPSLRNVSITKLDSEIGERLHRVGLVAQFLSVFVDHACTGLDPHLPRVNGTLGAGPQSLYVSLILERDPILQRVIQEGRTISGTLTEQANWLRQHTRNTEVMCTWLERVAMGRITHLSVIPARGWLCRGAIYAFHAQAPTEMELFTLSYAAQRLAQAMELRDRPYLEQLLNLKFTAREADILRAGLRGEADESIAKRLDLSVDAIRYYFKKFKHRVPATIGHMKPRELARVLHQLGKL